MKEILLHDPVPTSDRLERLHLFAGRHLGEDEFDRMQAYGDERLAPLLTAFEPGIVRGLGVSLGQRGLQSEGFTVSPGLAVAGNGQSLGLYYPIRQTWQTLIQSYLDETGAASAAGVFYMTLRRTPYSIDVDQDIDACQRTELDPTRDTRRVMLGSLALRRLGIAADAPATSTQERIENWVAANHIDGDFLRRMVNAVPLALLAVTEPTPGNYTVEWFSGAAGRYMAVPGSGYLVLLNQVNEALRRVMAESAAAVDETLTLGDFLDSRLMLDFLPAAGQLPVQMLEAPASPTPNLLWFPEHLGIDMVAAPEEAIPELIDRHLGRRVVDLREPAGDRIRLLLAINEPDYRPDLLDIPQTDAQLEADTFRYFMRAHKGWQSWLQAFNHLYFLLDEDALAPAEAAALDLPEPIDSPIQPQAVFADVIAKAQQELTTPAAPALPHPYNAGPPTPPDFYTSWLVPDPANPSTSIPPGVAAPAQNGLVIRYRLTELEIEQIENQIRATRTRVEKTRDYLLLQRQQLDSQTVSLSALAGGVAGDGAGLRVARWLPFTSLKTERLEAPTPPPADGEQPEPQTVSKPARTTLASLTQLAGASTLASVAKFAQPLAPSTVAPVTAFGFADIARTAVTAQVLKSALPKATTQPVARAQPTQMSTLQFGLNAERLERLAELPKQALTTPAFDVKEYRFGVLDHIQPDLKEYKMAYRGMAELITTLDGLFDPREAASLKKQLKRFGSILSPEQLAALDQPTGDAETDKQNAIQARYEELFKAGQVLAKQIAFVEARYDKLEARLEAHLRDRVRKEAELRKLAALIAEATEKLESVDKQRIELLGDYGVAQRLIEDDWRDVYERNEKRTRILTQELRGLYFVRVRPTPITASLADPLELRHGQAEDIVPGCDWVEDPELPEDLEEFFDSVLEVPMDDWRDLQPLRAKLPQPQRIDYVQSLRKARFDTRRTLRAQPTSRTPLKARLQTLSVVNESVLQQLATRTLPPARGSLRRFNEASAQVLSLEDLLGGMQGEIRRMAQQLRDRLEQAVACLLEQLNELQPSIRLQWAELAEEDRLPVATPGRWPGLERAEQKDFNATRTLAELVEWWFRQIRAEASSAGKAAMQNMIRASLIHAALGDPAEILHGQVHVPPRQFKVGEALRLKLNRRAGPGTRLQLMDDTQRIVGLLNVEDHDDKGTIANVVRVDRKEVSINTRFTVIASKLTKRLKS